MQKIEQSMLTPAAAETSIIPNGVDLSVFQPADQGIARSSIGIQPDAKVILFAAIHARQNIFKGYHTMRSAVTLIAKQPQCQKMILIVLGEDAPPEHIGQTEIRFVPYEKDPKVVARYYQASDVYIHAARADTFPTTILESMACGTPVVATAVGGIPEQVRDGVTGFLVPPEDAETMAKAILMFLTNDTLRTQLGYNAAQDAKKRFGLSRQVDAYLEWYRAIVERQNMERSPFQPANM
jgi:glycosyltransferase involved in cell wall biosynthesis